MTKTDRTKKPYSPPRIEKLPTTLQDIANGNGGGADFNKARNARASV